MSGVLSFFFILSLPPHAVYYLFTQAVFLNALLNPISTVSVPGYCESHRSLLLPTTGRLCCQRHWLCVRARCVKVAAGLGRPSGLRITLARCRRGEGGLWVELPCCRRGVRRGPRPLGRQDGFSSRTRVLVTRPSEGSGSYGRNSAALSKGKEGVIDSRRQPRRRGRAWSPWRSFLLSGKEQGVTLQNFEPRRHLLIKAPSWRVSLPSFRSTLANSNYWLFFFFYIAMLTDLHTKTGISFNNFLKLRGCYKRTTWWLSYVCNKKLFICSTDSVELLLLYLYFALLTSFMYLNIIRLY